MNEVFDKYWGASNFASSFPENIPLTYSFQVLNVPLLLLTIFLAYSLKNIATAETESRVMMVGTSALPLKFAVVAYKVDTKSEKRGGWNFIYH